MGYIEAPLRPVCPQPRSRTVRVVGAAGFLVYVAALVATNVPTRALLRLRRADNRTLAPPVGTSDGRLGAVIGLALALVSGCGTAVGQTQHEASASAVTVSSPSPGPTLPSPAQCAATGAPSQTPIAESARPAGVVQATIPIDSGPGAVAVGFGAIWVAAHRSNTMYRIDPKSNRVGASVVPDIGRDYGMGSITTGSTGVWLPLSSEPDALLLIDPMSNRVESSFDLPGQDPFLRVTWGPGLWAYLSPAPGRPDKRLVKLDPTTGQVLQTVDLGVGNAAPDRYWPDVVYAFNSLWTVIQDNELARVDPSTGTVTAVVKTPGVIEGYGNFAIEGDHLFLAQRDETLVRINSQTNCVDGLLFIGAHLPPTPNRTAAQMSVISVGSVLYVAFDRGALAVIDPASMRVLKSVRVDFQDYVGAPISGFGSIWFPTFGNDSVLRLKPLV